MQSRVPAPFRVIGRSIVDWWDGWLDMVVTIIVWFLAQLTVVFGPPATFGLYYVVHNMVNGQAYGARGLVEGARLYFGKAWIWGILTLLAAITIYVNFIFYGAVEAVWGLYVQVFITLLAAIWLLTNFYALPFFMEQEKKSIRIALRNGLFTTLAAPFFSLLLLALVLLVAGLSTVFIIPIFLGLPGLIPMLGVRAMYNRLETFGLRQPEKTPKEIEYEEGGKVNVPGRNQE
jgi:uncharacterized membrane protein YesL